MVNASLLSVIGLTLPLLIGGSQKLPIEEVWVYGYLELNHCVSQDTEIHQFIIWEIVDGQPYVRQYLMDNSFFKRRNQDEIDKIWRENKTEILKHLGLTEWPNDFKLPIKTTYYVQSAKYMVYNTSEDVVFLVHSHDTIWKLHFKWFIETYTNYDREVLNRQQIKTEFRRPIIKEKTRNN